MTTPRLFQRALVALALFAGAHGMAVAQRAAPTEEQVLTALGAKCRSLADAPQPYGEWDLKGNDKLPAYCECYAGLFFKRAAKVSAYMDTHNGKPPPATLAQVHAQEMAMRQTCRKKLDLPKAIAPPKPAKAAKPTK